MEGIYINHIKIWNKSYKLIKEILEKRGYWSPNPRLLLNFGNNHSDDSITVLNPKISHIMDKVKMNQLFDKYKMPHPLTLYYPFTNLPNLKRKCVIKKRFGSRGTHIKFTFFNKISSLNLTDDYYIQHFVPFEREYRVVNFIGHYRSRKKIGNAEIKNSESCRFKNYRDKPLEKFAKEICEKFELDFAGLDIGEYNNHYFIIEINSACGLNENSAQVLSHFLIKYYNKLIKNE